MSPCSHPHPQNERVPNGGFCISPRNEYTVSGGYAKTLEKGDVEKL